MKIDVAHMSLSLRFTGSMFIVLQATKGAEAVFLRGLILNVTIILLLFITPKNTNDYDSIRKKTVKK